MKKLILCFVALSFLNACANDAYTGESKVSKTAWGTGIGTAVGAGLGAIVGGEKGALIGAGIGAAAHTGAGTAGACRRGIAHEGLPHPADRPVRFGFRRKTVSFFCQTDRGRSAQKCYTISRIETFRQKAA